MSEAIPQITVVIPIYNAATLITRCIDSILDQTTLPLEVIIVDDGSTDDSLLVCRGLEQQHSCIKVFHKENGGQASARRFGVEHATGVYVYFVDADDVLPAGALQQLYNKAVENNLDMVDGASMAYYENATIKEKVSYVNVGEFDQKTYLQLMYSDQTNMGTHACLIRRSLFTPEVFDIPADVRLGEDEYIHLCLAVQAHRIGIYNFDTYHYIMNTDSITHQYTYTSIRPTEHQIESIRRIMLKYDYFNLLKRGFYWRAVGSLATACLRNRQFIHDHYVQKMGKEAYPYVKGMDKALCLMMRFPCLYPLFYWTNELRKKIKTK